MSRTLDEVLAALPDEERQRIETRAAELRQEIEAQWEALGIDPSERRDDERQFIPVEESFAEWEKDPEYLRCRAELEREEAMGAFDPANFPQPPVRKKPMSAVAAQAFAELRELGASVLDRDNDGSEFVMNTDAGKVENFELPADIDAVLKKHRLEWHWLWHVTWMGGTIGIYPAEGDAS